MIGEVILPWPVKELSPNARVHWAVKAAATKSARTNAGWATKAAGIPKLPSVPLKLTVTYNPPSRRKLDGDNLISRLKPVFDGIADAIGVDDSKFKIEPPIRAEPVKHGAVKITLEVA